MIIFNPNIINETYLCYMPMNNSVLSPNITIKQLPFYLESLYLNFNCLAYGFSKAFILLGHFTGIDMS